MGGVWNKFCPKSRHAKLDKKEQAILECKLVRDKIKSYIKRLEKNEQQRKEKAKLALKDKNREKAKLFLTQSKMYREQIQSANGQLNLIEDQIVRIETAQFQKEAFQVLQKGNEVLKQLQEEVNIDKWEKIADDMNEFRQQQEEIGNFLKSRGIDESQQEEEVNNELEKLMKYESIDVEVNLPDARKDVVQTRQSEREEKPLEDPLKENLI